MSLCSDVRSTCGNTSLYVALKEKFQVHLTWSRLPIAGCQGILLLSSKVLELRGSKGPGKALEPGRVDLGLNRGPGLLPGLQPGSV